METGTETQVGSTNEREIDFYTAEHITLESCLKEKDYGHAVHCMIWSKWENHLVLRRLNPYAAVLMQFRCDAAIGFPGGMIDDDMRELTLEQAEDMCLNGLIRELEEEMNVDPIKYVITKQDYLRTYRHPTKKLFLHFYTLEVSIDNFLEIEANSLKSTEMGHEVFGYIRVPLFTMKGDYKGFPLFLNQHFIRASRQQLLEALEAKSIMTKDEISKVLESCRVNKNFQM